MISARANGTASGVIREYPHITASDIATALAYYLHGPEQVGPYIAEAMDGR